jgi:hypothetical protein
MQAQAVQGMSLAIRMLGELMNKVGAASPMGKDIAKAIYDLNKHVPAGAVQPAGEANQLDALRQRLMSQGPQMAALKAMQGPGGPGGGGAPPAGLPGPMPGGGGAGPPGAGAPPMPPPG